MLRQENGDCAKSLLHLAGLKPRPCIHTCNAFQSSIPSFPVNFQTVSMYAESSRHSHIVRNDASEKYDRLEPFWP